MNNKVLITIIIIVVVLAIGISAYYFGFRQGQYATEQAYKEFIERASTTPGVVNPTENLPTTNPFEGVKVNPFEGVYKNPFK